MNKHSGFLAFLALAACGSGSRSAVLSQLTDVTSSTKCPTGGVAITAGPDTNGNGLLEASEVTQTSEVCNGAAGRAGPIGASGDAGVAGPGSLINTTAIAAGDMTCPTGGVRIDFGTDDGAGGGTAGNGQLEGGEIRASRTVCNGTKGGSYPSSVTPPPGPAGANRISSNGARGLEGNGGDAGNIDLTFEEFAGSLGGHIKVFKTGAADAGFSMPAITFDPGLNPMPVTANYTLKAYSSVPLGVTSADPYFQTTGGGGQIFSHDAGVVTSLSIAPGTILLITGTSASNANVQLTGDVKNAGTILVGANGASSKNMSLQAGRFTGAAGSAITTTGLPAGNGGDVSISAVGVIAYEGTITTSGGDLGGNAGSLSFQSQQSTVSLAGTFTMFGGTNSTGAGGRGGSFAVFGFGAFSGATIRGSGGNGTTAGGQGGPVQITTLLLGIGNRGSVVMRGGNCTAVACRAGNGGAANITAQGADLIWNGTLDVGGGGAPGLGNAFGGNAGRINVVHGETVLGSALRLANGATRFSGDLLAEGGEGANGGLGGGISVKKNCAFNPLGQEIEFLGYADLTANGGAGTAGTTPGRAGNGGTVTIANAASTLFFAYDSGGSNSIPVLGAGGGVINSANITARGGDGPYPGQSFSVTLSSQTQRSLEGSSQIVVNTGTIDVSSGSGPNSPQNAGSVVLSGVNGVESRGDIKSTGGSSTGSANGGAGGQVQIISYSGPSVIAAPITVNGGVATSASTVGGSSGYAVMYGKPCTISANITANGGNAVTTGGAGGQIQVLSLNGAPTNPTGTLSVAGGTGVTPGPGGATFVDGKFTRY